MRRQLTADQLTGFGIMSARHFRGLTINELADLLGWHRNTLSRCEDGLRHVREVELLGIAAVLDWPVEALRRPLLPESVEAANLPLANRDMRRYPNVTALTRPAACFQPRPAAWTRCA